MERNELVQRMAEAIAIMEGYMDKEFNPRPNTIAYRHKNPGNIRAWGQRKRVGGYAVFDDHDQGWKALYQQINKNIDRGLTLREFFGGKPGVYAGYAPYGDRNNPTKYAEHVGQYLRKFTPKVMGIDQVIKGLFGEEVVDVQPAS